MATSEEGDRSVVKKNVGCGFVVIVGNIAIVVNQWKWRMMCMIDPYIMLMWIFFDGSLWIT